jgi:hypothetical protein
VSTLAAMEDAVREMQKAVRTMPAPVREDVETIARSFRNTLALGPSAAIALMIVSGEVAIAAKRRGTAF